MALAGGPLAAALLTEGRFADAGVRILFLLAVGVVLAGGAALALRRVDTRGARESDARERALRQARDQQAATAEILTAIAVSPPDLQRVLDTIARNAARVCDGVYAVVFRSDGAEIRLAAHHGLSSTRLEGLNRRYPRGLDDDGATERAIRRASVVHYPDIPTDPSAPAGLREFSLTEGFRSLVIVPMLREGRVLGTLNVSRPEGGFTERQIQLLRTFADQAVIAIENVRLFKELEVRNRALTEALEQQTATAEILGVISRSPTDLQPVLEAVARNASRLCGAANVSLYRVEGDQMRKVAEQGPPLTALRVGEIRPITRTRVSGRAIVDRTTIHVPDHQSAESAREYPDARRDTGIRTTIGIPLLREGVAIGAFTAYRTEARPFSEREIALLQTFADQAVIAIENVRLFQELQARNRELSEALEQQTATADILRVISSSPTDLQPVMTALAESAARLCGADNVVVHRLEAGMFRAMATVGSRPTVDFPIARATPAGRAALNRETVHVPDLLSVADEYPETMLRIGQTGSRAMLVAPLLRPGEVVGTIMIRRDAPGPFTDKQVRLLETFAAQAVIAIENVRLFQELEARNRDLTEALEQQTATGEILRVISGSPTDTQPVFDAIVGSAARLGDAARVGLIRLEGRMLVLDAYEGMSEAEMEIHRHSWPREVAPDSAGGRAILTREIVHITDATKDPEYSVSSALTLGYRTALSVPLMREGAAIGAISLWRSDVRPFTDKQIQLVRTFADQAVIAIENVRLFRELQARNRELTEALEQQTATAEILRVISSSPTDLAPVMEAVVRNAARLARADHALVGEAADGRIRWLAASGFPLVSGGPPISRELPTGRAILDCQTTQVEDVTGLTVDFPGVRRAYDELGVRTILATPLVREGLAIGVLLVRRTRVQPFTDKEIGLLRTFADQAVIAIENVRLFRALEARNRELTESLEQQTATSEILRAISSSPTDVQPVFDAIVQSAVPLCGAVSGSVFRFDGSLIHLVAQRGMTAEALDAVGREFPRPPGRGTTPSRAILTRGVVHVDIAQDPEYDAQTLVRAGFRTALSVPMLREGHPIGVITVNREASQLFTDTQIALLQTFADQAVIAIENVRLFTELEARNRELTESLEQQTATSEILRAISSSPTDTQPVFDTIAQRAFRVCDGSHCVVFQFDGRLIHVVAHHAQSPDALQEFQRAYPLSPAADTMAARAIREGAVVHGPDLLNDPSEAVRRIARAGGYRTGVIVPMLRSGRAVGAIAVGRSGPGGESRPYTEKEIALLQTFADQGVIAVENVRLFRELETRTKELARSVEELTALGEVSRAVSATLDVETVLQTVVSHASKLAAADGGSIFEYDEATEEFRLRATHDYEPELSAVLHAMPPRMGEGVIGSAAQRREPMQVADIAREGAYQSRFRDVLLRVGYHALLAVPLVREDHVIGALSVNRKAPGEFPAEVVELLRTFATQSALAIQNARLFREIETKGRELEVASRHKSQFLANMSHELRTPLNAILGYTELLVDGIYGDLSPKAGDVMTRIDRSGKHLLGLINDVLDLSKIEAGQLELGLAEYSLTEVVNAVVTQVEALTAEKALTLQVAVAPDLPAGRGDERRLAQVLLNLVGNAIKFTEVGSIRIAAYRDGDAFVVSVADTGPGIAEADRQRIFEEFQQADSSSTRKKGGTGLGLSIARRIVELHGGRLWVESAVGRGSTFSFRVPVRVERQVVRA
jgi:GAF domain-containing protein/two-component sensor histidine kinase